MPGRSGSPTAASSGKRCEQPVDERAVRVAGSGMDDEPGRLVDDDDVVVGVDDGELDVLVGRRQRRSRDRRRVDLDEGAGVEAHLPRRGDVAVDPHAAGLRPPLLRPPG